MNLSNNGMSKKMYDFILENKNRIEYDFEKGIIFTPRGTNGTICSSTGYLRVKINKKILQVHQIMAVHYFGELCIGLQVNHKDGDKLNNKKENLELLTLRENVAHQHENGLAVNGNKRKIDKLTMDGDYICTYESLMEACRRNNIGIPQSIRNAIKGYNPDNTNCSQAGGFKWRYSI